MAGKLDIREMVDSEGLLLSEIITTEALINVLDRKGLITKAEVLEVNKGCKGKSSKKWIILGTQYLISNEGDSASNVITVNQFLN